MIVGGCSLDGRSGHEAGRELLRRLYRMETGQALPEIRISPAGKPYFPDSPLCFSITHTPRHAFCVLADCNVGIDAEEMDRTVREGTFRRTLSPAEQLRVASCRDRRMAFLRLWVLKEADAKRSGEGLRGFPVHTDFLPEDPRIHEFLGCFVAVLPDNETKGVIFHAF